MSGDTTNLGMGLGNNQSSVFGTSGVSSTENTSSVSSTGSTQTTGLPSKDTIEAQSALIAALQLQMAIPFITPPDYQDFAMIQKIAIQDICTNILNKWSESIAEIAEQKREDEKKARLHPQAAALELHAAAGLVYSVAIIFIRAVFGTTVAEALDKTPQTDTDQTLTKRFGSQLADWAQKGIIQGYVLSSIVDKLPAAISMNEPTKKIVAKQVEVLLLGSAIAALYKADTKWVTSEEIFALIQNPSAIQNPNMKQIATLLINDLAELPPAAKAKLLNTLKSYFDTNPELPSLLDLGNSLDVQLSIFNNTAS